MPRKVSNNRTGDPAGRPPGAPARRRDPRVDIPPPPAFEAASAERAIRVMWAGLALLAFARCALAFVPGMWVWSLNLNRFLAPPVAWGPWLIAAAALIPAVSRRLEPAIARLGDALMGRTAPVALFAGFAAAMVLGLPDRTRFVGDFLLRQGTVEEAGAPAVLFPQAMPLDVLLHFTFPRALSAAGLADANVAARLLGAAEAAALAVLAVAFARALASRGTPAVAVVATVLFSGCLGMFTGFGKAFAEMVLVVAALGATGLRVLRDGRGLLRFGVVFVAGLTLHRSALALLPAAILVWTLWLRDHGRSAAVRRPGAWLALAIPVAGLALTLPRIVALMRQWDALHLLPEPVRAQGGPLAAAFAGARLPDMLNLALFLSPIALPALAAMVAMGRPRTRGREAALVLLLALPMALAMTVIHPAQGLFRDWDDFAALGLALSLLAAWVVGESLRAAPRLSWIGVAVTLTVATVSWQWLVHWTDTDRGLARVEAFMREAPARTVAERATTWDFLGIRNLRLGRDAAAAAALRHAAAVAPSPRILLELATAEARSGDLRGAQSTYRRVVARDSTHLAAWKALGVVSESLGDTRAVEAAARAIRALEPARGGARGTTPGPPPR